MTKDEINKRVAELMGWRRSRPDSMRPALWYKTPKSIPLYDPPDFCGDPLLWGPAFVNDVILAERVPGMDGVLWRVSISGTPERAAGWHAELVPAFWLARLAREAARRGEG